MHLDQQHQLREEELITVVKRKMPMMIGSLREAEEEKERAQIREAAAVKNLMVEENLLVIREIMIMDRNQEGDLPVEPSRLTFAMPVEMRIGIEALRVKLREVVVVVRVEGAMVATTMIMEIQGTVRELQTMGEEEEKTGMKGEVVAVVEEVEVAVEVVEVVAVEVAEVMVDHHEMRPQLATPEVTIRILTWFGYVLSSPYFQYTNSIYHHSCDMMLQGSE